MDQNIKKAIARNLRKLANKIDPPGNVLTVTVRLDTSEFMLALDSMRRRLTAPCIKGDVP